MSRIQYIPVTQVGATTYQLSFLRSGYVNLNRQNFSASVHVIGQEECYQADLISYNVYGDSTYWWVILFFNDILNPLVELTPGVTLQIPDLNEVLSFLNSQNQNNQIGQPVTV